MHVPVREELLLCSTAFSPFSSTSSTTSPPLCDVVSPFSPSSSLTRFNECSLSILSQSTDVIEVEVELEVELEVGFCLALSATCIKPISKYLERRYQSFLPVRVTHTHENVN